MNNQTSQLEMKLRKKKVNLDDSVDIKTSPEIFTKLNSLFLELGNMYLNPKYKNGDYMKATPFFRINDDLLANSKNILSHPLELYLWSQKIDEMIYEINRCNDSPTSKTLFEDGLVDLYVKLFDRLVDDGYKNFMLEHSLNNFGKGTDEYLKKFKDVHLDVYSSYWHGTTFGMNVNFMDEIDSLRYIHCYGCNVNFNKYSQAPSIFSDSTVVFHEGGIVHQAINSKINLKKNFVKTHSENAYYANSTFNVYDEDSYDKMCRHLDATKNNFKLNVNRLVIHPGPGRNSIDYNLEKIVPNIVNLMDSEDNVLKTQHCEWGKR